MLCIAPPRYFPPNCAFRKTSADLASYIWNLQSHDFAHAEFDSKGVNLCACGSEHSTKPFIGLNNLVLTIVMFVRHLGVKTTNVSALFNLHDTLPLTPLPTTCAPPIVVTDRPITSRESVSTPTFNHFLASWNDFQNVTDLATTPLLPWSQRIDKVVWRGSVHYMGNLHTMRSALVRLGSTRRDMFDVKGHCITLLQQARYRYSVYTPGALNAFAWRLPAQLALGMLMFIPVSRSDSWFSVALEPGVHYVAIQNDLSDLLSKLHWAQKHPREAESIAMRAREFARTQYSNACVRRHFKTTMRNIGRHFGSSKWNCPEECARTRVRIRKQTSAS